MVAHSLPLSAQCDSHRSLLPMQNITCCLATFNRVAVFMHLLVHKRSDGTAGALASRREGACNVQRGGSHDTARWCCHKADACATQLGRDAGSVWHMHSNTTSNCLGSLGSRDGGGGGTAALLLPGGPTAVDLSMQHHACWGAMPVFSVELDSVGCKLSAHTAVAAGTVVVVVVVPIGTVPGGGIERAAQAD